MTNSRIWTVLSLFVTCLLSAFALSVVYSQTRQRIYQLSIAGIRAAFAEVMPTADSFAVLTPDSSVWAAFEGGRRCGTIVRAAERGYGGPVPVTAGVDTTGTITGIRIAGPVEGLKETQGLGTKVLEPEWRAQFVGKSPAEILLDRDGGTISAVTGATISSRAVANGLRDALERYASLLRP
ncbi:MAG: FMN-binding protein [candidate division WOR-3 bacterium]